MSDTERLLDENDTIGLAALVAAGEVSSLELVDASIARIESRNPALNAVVAKRYEQARSEAKNVTANSPSLAFHSSSKTSTAMLPDCPPQKAADFSLMSSPRMTAN